MTSRQPTQCEPSTLQPAVPDHGNIGILAARGQKLALRDRTGVQYRRDHPPVQAEEHCGRALPAALTHDLASVRLRLAGFSVCCFAGLSMAACTVEKIVSTSR